MAFKIAEGFVEVTARLASGAVRRDAGRAGREAGRTFGTSFDSAARMGLGRARQQVGRTFQGVGREAGQQAGRTFGQQFGRETEQGFRRSQEQMTRSFQGMRREADETGRGIGRSIGGGSTAAAGAVGGLTAKLGGAKGGVLAVGAAFLVTGKQVLGTSGDFEKAMNKVGAITSATGQDFEDLRNLAKRMGATTAFSASEAADAMAFLGMAGFKTREIISALPGVLNLAAAANTDLATTADIASNIMSGFGIEAREMGRVSDVLAHTMRSTNVDLRMLGESMKYAAPLAKAAGWSFEETAAAVGFLGNAGIQGSMAGTGLNSILATLSDTSSTGGRRLKEFGVAAQDANGRVRPLTDILKDLAAKGADVADVIGIFGLEAGPKLQALLGQGSDGILKLIDELENSQGVAQEMADRQMEGLKGSMMGAKSAIEGLVLAIGDLGLLKGATATVDVFTGGVRRLTSAVEATPKLIGGLRERISGLFSGVQGENADQAAAGVEKVAASFQRIRDSATGAAERIRERFASLGERISGLWDKVTGTFEKFRADHGSKIEDLFGKASGVVSGFGDTVADLVDLFGAVFDKIIWVVEKAIGVVEWLWEIFGESLVETLFGFGEGLFRTLEGIFRTLQGLFQTLTGVLTGDWQKAWDGIKNIFGGLWDSILGILSLAWNSIVGTFKMGFDLVSRIVSDLVGFILKPFRWLYDKLVGNSIIPDMVNRITQWFYRLRDWALAPVRYLRDKATEAFTKARDWITTRVQALRDRVVTRLTNLRNTAIARVQSLRDRATSLVTNMRDWVTTRAQTLRDRVVTAFNQLRDRTINAFKRAADGVKTVFGKLRSAASSPVKFVIDPVYNKGVRAVWNNVVSKIPGVGRLPHMSIPKGFAKGGITDVRDGATLSGYSSTDDQLAMVRSGEGILVPEAVKSLGPWFIHKANQLKHRASELLGIPGFRIGGIVGKFKSKAKGFFAGGFVKALKAATGPIVAQVTDRFGAGENWRALPGRTLAAGVGKMVGFLSKFADLLEGGDGRKVVEVAEKYVGQGGNPNKWTRRMGMNGLPWCGMFVDGVFDEAGAKRALRGVANPAAVRSYRTLPRVSRANAKAGDLALYRGDDGHINIYTGRGAITIGGNESNRVRKQSGYINSASSIRRPRFRAGGIVEHNPDLAAFLFQDRRETSWLSTPARTRHLRDIIAAQGLPAFLRDMGGILPHGGIAVNTSGQAEVVQTLDQLRAIVQAARGQHITYVFEEGAITLDASKLRDIQDLLDMIDGLRSTARQHGARVRVR